MSARYRTSPVPSPKMPGGIPYIVGNEAAERFSFYGMRAILYVFLTKHLTDAAGELAPMTDLQARSYQHMFLAAVYFFPLLGALVSDIVLGKYRTIVSLSIVYCLGHLALALMHVPLEPLHALTPRTWLFVGLTLIAIGAGGIKPCVSAHVGDQFGAQNQHFLPRVFAWFYFSINLGAFVSTLLTPWLLENVGPATAFGTPGVLMFLATVVFWLGRYRFIHIPPAGAQWARDMLRSEGVGALLKLLGLYVFVAMFWSLFDQTTSAWVEQAEKMNRVWLGHEWLPAQIQAANPILVLVLIPVFSYGIYPAVYRVFSLTPLRKIGIGLFVTAAAFGLSAWIESRLDAGQQLHIAWQLGAYVVLTSAEILVSITCLEFSYTQAPNRMKSFIMSLYLLSVSAGNLFTSGVNYFIQNPDGSSKLSGPSYYLLFAGLMLLAAGCFVIYARHYRERTYIQQ